MIEDVLGTRNGFQNMFPGLRSQVHSGCRLHFGRQAYGLCRPSASGSLSKWCPVHQAQSELSPATILCGKQRNFQDNFQAVHTEVL